MSNPLDSVAGLSLSGAVPQPQPRRAAFTEGNTGDVGPSMIGYGQVHYRYASGREGDTFRLGFSPRKAKISLHGLTGSPESGLGSYC